jgi:large subunit ribosomal protein L7/L12
MADEIKEKIEVSEEGKKMIEIIKGMKIADLNNVVKALEQEFGVSAQAPVMMAAGAAAGAAGEEKSSFNIELKEVGAKKIEVIKVVRDLTGKGLKEAKDLVDAAATAPQMVKENAKKEEAEDIKKKFEAAGAKVELK